MAAKFSRPFALMLHTLAFVVTMTAIWAYGLAWRLWQYRENYTLPVVIGVGWSLLLAIHALYHYRRSSARAERREVAVEEEMRHLIETGDDQIDHDDLFATHHSLAAGLERQGRWSLALLAFALVNALSWTVSAIDMGTSWPFQTTIPLAVLTIGGGYTFLSWQQRQQERQGGWFARLPLRHIVAYGAGSLALVLAAAFRLINPWDANNLMIVWSVILFAHIIGMLAVWPLIRRFLPQTASQEQPAKRKPGTRLVLADDGEMLNVNETDGPRFRARASRS